MRIGIISDVHGDYDTLMKTLEQLEHHHHVDQILCAGDLVGRGPQENAVVDVIRQRRIVTVRGNHDEFFSGVSTENAQFLKQLPLEWQAQFDDMTVYMCHGKPGNNMWGMYRDHLSKTYVNMVLGALKADVLITGHTHIPLFMRVERGCLLNPGSLYTFNANRETSHTYGILSLPDLNFELFDASASNVLPVSL
jgi:putative phosphoesterase